MLMMLTTSRNIRPNDTPMIAPIAAPLSFSVYLEGGSRSSSSEYGVYVRNSILLLSDYALGILISH